MKKRIATVGIVIAMLMTACGAQESDDVSSMTIDKNGAVTETIVTAFDKDYYNLDELSRTVQAEVDEYNSGKGSEAVSFKEASNVEETSNVKVVIKYDSFSDYAAMNDKVLFVGSISEAKDAGYGIDQMTSADGSTTISAAEMESMEGKMIVVETMMDAERIKVPGKIQYVSSDVTVEDSKHALLPAKEDNKCFIIYK